MYWLVGRRSALSIGTKLMLYKYWKPCGPTAYSCGDARNRATLTSFIDFKTRYLGTSLMHLGISETPTSTGTFKWRWLRVKLESSLRSMKKGFCTTSTSKRSSCPTKANWCERLKGGGEPFELVQSSLKAAHSEMHHKHYECVIKIGDSVSAVITANRGKDNS